MVIEININEGYFGLFYILLENAIISVSVKLIVNNLAIDIFREFLY